MRVFFIDSPGGGEPSHITTNPDHGYIDSVVTEVEIDDYLANEYFEARKLEHWLSTKMWNLCQQYREHRHRICVCGANKIRTCSGRMACPECELNNF